MSSILALIKSFFAKIVAFFTRKKEPETTSAPEPSSEDPSIIVVPEPWTIDDIVCYYGCPNSKKAQKLQLNKKAYR